MNTTTYTYIKEHKYLVDLEHEQKTYKIIEMVLDFHTKTHHEIFKIIKPYFDDDEQIILVNDLRFIHKKLYEFIDEVLAWLMEITTINNIDDLYNQINDFSDNKVLLDWITNFKHNNYDFAYFENLNKEINERC